MRKKEKKPVTGTIIEKKIIIYSAKTFDRNNAKAKRLETKRRLGLYYYYKQPGYILVIYPNKNKLKGLNKI